MTSGPESLSSQIARLSSELRQVDQRLRSEAPPDGVTLNDFRQAVDNLRLTAWTVSEVMNARNVNENPDTVLAFLAAERLRRFDQLVRNLCSDIDRRVITADTNGMSSMVDSVIALHQRLARWFRSQDKTFKKAAG